MSSELVKSLARKQKLQECVMRIKARLPRIIEDRDAVAADLQIITDERLYLETHKTYKEFVEETFGFTDRWARHLVCEQRLITDSKGSTSGSSSASETKKVADSEGQEPAEGNPNDDRSPTEEAAEWRAAQRTMDESDSEPPEEDTLEDRIRIKNHELESFCRKITKLIDEEFPKDEWLNDMGRGESARRKLADGLSAIRSAKCACACPGCSGTGCYRCHKTGRVPKGVYDQMV